MNRPTRPVAARQLTINQPKQLTRREWSKLSSTSVAKAGRPPHLSAAVSATYLVVLVILLVILWSASGTLGAVIAVVVAPFAGSEAAHLVEREVRWRFYRSLWDES